MSKPAPKWLKNAVFYEIYPQSFYDTNADGIGDINGIIAKLDYIKSLHIDAIWINPCFDSPFQDAGYDVRDYYKVAERYGTNDDLKRLFAEAKKRGMHILLDLVPGHTSIQCKWFQQASSAAPSEYDNYYMFTQGWGGEQDGYRFISGYGSRDGYYMINFFYSQPALNYGFSDPRPDCPWQLPCDHPDVKRVREEMRNVMKFYLDMGCSGFRVDMAASLVRGKNGKAEARYALWQDYSSWMRKNYPDSVLVAEWGHPEDSIPAGFDVDFFLSWGKPTQGYPSLFRKETYEYASNQLKTDTARSFFSPESSGDSRSFCDEFTAALKRTRGNGYCSIVTGNHDLPRIRRGREIADLKVAYTAIFTLPGTPFLYYGDEIGMRYLPQVGNVEGSYNRGGARTPMQWTPGEKAGFSEAAPEKFYTMVDPDPARPCVETQENDPDSLLNFTRRLIELRRNHRALSADGDFQVLISEHENAPWVYRRDADGEHFLIVLNPSKNAMEVDVAAGKGRKIWETGKVEIEWVPGAAKVKFAPVSAAIFQLD